MIGGEPLDGMILSNSLRTAVAGLAKTMSRELGAARITVNNVCPGHVMTARLREIAAFRAAEKTLDVRGATEAIPLQRLQAETIPIDGGSTASIL